MNSTSCMSTSNFKFQVIYEVSIQVIVFTVLAFYQRILKLGLKMMSFSKSAFLGLLKSVLTFNPRWLEGRVVTYRLFGYGHWQVFHKLSKFASTMEGKRWLVGGQIL